MTTTLQVSFAVGNKAVDSVVIKKPTFVQFCSMVATADKMQQPSTFEGRLKRVRMQRQVDFTMNGQPIELNMIEILQMPFNVARLIHLEFDADLGESGKIIREGDGVSTAIGFQLGQPVPVAQGKDPIGELEFLAKTYGDVEDVFGATETSDQTLALLKTVAKPVHSSLTALPSWAIDAISVADGVAIARHVLPRFLGNGDESD